MVEASDVAASILCEAGVRPAFDDLIISTPETFILINSGQYEAVCTYCRKVRRFSRNLLWFKFKIVSQGRAFGTVLDGFVNLEFGRGKSTAAPPRSKLARWLRIIHEFDSRVSIKQFKLSTFSEFQFTVLVETSDTDHDQESCEPTSRVSKILDVVGRVGRPNR